MFRAVLRAKPTARVNPFGEEDDDLSPASLLASLREAGVAPSRPVPTGLRTTKRSLTVVAEAIKRSFASALASELLDSAVQTDALLVGCFQRRAYFEQESLRYGALAAAGATVVVGCADGLPELPNLVHGLDLSGRPEFARSFVLLAACGNLAAALVAIDDRHVVPGGRTIEASRSFVARWTFRRREAVSACRQVLVPLAPRLETRVLAQAESALRRADVAPAHPAEDALESALERIGLALAEPGPARGALGEIRDPLTETDLLTGLWNRRYLEGYLRSRAGESPLTVLGMLIDVDDLGRLNATRGPEAGDAALRGVAGVLRAETVPGDVVVRSGDDEFVVLAQLDAGGPLAQAERLCAAVRGMRLPRPYEQERVTVSIGAVVADPVRLPFDRMSDGLQLAKLLGKDAPRLVE